MAPSLVNLFDLMALILEPMAKKAFIFIFSMSIQELFEVDNL